MGRMEIRPRLSPRVAAVLAVGLSACGDPIGDPDIFTFPDVVDFRGDYGVTHTFSVPGTARTAGCTGDAQLSTDQLFGFGGTLDIDASGPCAGLPGDVGQVVGAISGSQTITFSVEGLRDPLAAIGCSITGGPRNFEGTFTTRQVVDVVRVQTLRGTRDVRATCDGGPEEVGARWEIRASRR